MEQINKLSVLAIFLTAGIHAIGSLNPVCALGYEDSSLPPREQAALELQTRESINGSIEDIQEALRNLDCQHLKFSRVQVLEYNTEAKSRMDGYRRRYVPQNRQRGYQELASAQEVNAALLEEFVRMADEYLDKTKACR